MLAGISSDYYLRLEQGRDRNPSVQVLEALAAYCGWTPTRRRTSSASPRNVRAPSRHRAAGEDRAGPGRASSN